MHVTLKDELIERGYIASELVLDRIYRQYSLPTGELVLTKAGYYDFPFVTQTAKKVSKNKSLSYEYAKRHDVIIPATLQTLDLGMARDFLKKYKKIIIKPAQLGGGRGLTRNITTDEQLIQALTAATFNNLPPLLQEQFDGTEIRMTVISGKVRSVIWRQAPQVIGDGTNTIEKLIEQENSEREALVFPLLTYPQLDDQLIDAAWFHDQRVPIEGEVVTLAQTSMIGRGASFIGVTNEVDPSYCEIAERLARHLNPPMLVVDLLVKDFRVPAETGNYVFLEFNTSPGLQIYSSLRSGDTMPIVSLLADLVEQYATLTLQG